MSDQVSESGAPEPPGQLFVETQGEGRRFVDTAAAVGGHHPTVLLLIDDGVAQLRRPGIGTLNCAVWADEFSLRRRATAGVPSGVTPVDIDTVAELMLRPGVRTVWH